MSRNMYYVLSDIHGHYSEFIQRLNQIKEVSNPDDKGKLIILGDYIDRGVDSYKVLKTIFDIQRQYGSDNIIALRGNHEEWFLDFIFNDEDFWLVEDENFKTTKTFLNDEQLNEVKNIAKGKVKNVYEFIRKCIKSNHAELLDWMKKLPYYYKTDAQIFVHAGVDEEAEDWWEYGTPNYVFIEKFPPTKGKFYMDIIAGHTSTAAITCNKDYHEVYYDGSSHYYVDGNVVCSKYIPVLVYDAKKEKYFILSPEKKLISITESNK